MLKNEKYCVLAEAAVKSYWIGLRKKRSILGIQNSFYNKYSCCLCGCRR